MNNNPLVGWDIGGAHLKAVLVDSEGRVLQVQQQPCPLWRGLNRLEQAVAAVLAALESVPHRHAVTMTGELADIFPDRASGVQALTTCMTRCLGPQAQLNIYAGPAGFVAPEAINCHLLGIASANWHASAALLAAKAGEGLLIDIGSTTSDLIPLHDGRPAMHGYSDAERLQSEEMLYTGAVRTPVMAIAQRVPFAGEWQRLAAEHFATMADVYRLTGELPEGYDLADTADGAGKSETDSARRLARMVGRDLGDAPMAQWRGLAYALRAQQLQALQAALQRHLSRGLLADDAPFIGAGAGRFLARELARVMQRPYVDVAEYLSVDGQPADWASVCLPAYAVACLGREAALWH